MITRKSFPRQKIATSKKTDKWCKECIDAAITMAASSDSSKLRDSKVNMKYNYDLYDGILHPKDIKETINPWGFDASTFPAKMYCYPIATNKINLLLGEESKRLFDWKLRITNDDAISQKEKYIKETIVNMLSETAMKENLTEEEAQKAVMEAEKWRTYSSQDIRERLGTQILKHLWQEQQLKFVFNEGFKDALIAGEEIYCVDIVGKKPILRKVDPLSLTVIGNTSPFIEDSDIIIEITYQSPGWVIDNYYDYLTPKQIDELEIGAGLKTDSELIINYPDKENVDLRQALANKLIDIPDSGILGPARDSDGNVRVARVVWKSLRKVGILYYFDQQTGEQLSTLVDENYVPNKNLGEVVEWYWINEWWEGTKIAEDIYVKMQPRPIQFRRMDNLSISGSGYVGTIYNTNTGKANSIMNRMKPYVYMYNKLFYRLSKELSKYKGPMIELDLAKKPGSWDIDKWLYYAEEMGYMIIDSFNEGNKGKATGVLAGNFNTTNKAYNTESGDFISQVVNLLRYIEETLGAAVGITRQREGAIDNRETVGGVERSVTQSSHATEQLFFIHDYTKLRAMQVLLETAKVAYLNDNKVFQYISDNDMAYQIYKFDGSLFSEADYGLVLSNSNDNNRLKETLIQVAQMGIQSGTLDFSSFIDIYMSDSIADTRRKLEEAELKRIEQQQEAEKAQMEHEQKINRMQIENREDMQAHQIELEKLKIEKDIQLKLMELETRKEGLTSEEFELEKQKIMEELKLKSMDLAEKIRSNIANEKLKEKEIEVKRIQANKKSSSS